MKHRNPERMQQNAREAIPTKIYLSANQIFRRQGLPRLPRKELDALLSGLVHAHLVEKIEIGFMAYYRWRELALATAPAYNEARRKEFSLAPEVDWFATVLNPLRYGVAVHLSLEDPRYGRIKNYKGKKREQLVVLVPGQLIGLKSEYVLVAIIGAGSCLVRPANQGPKIADLVLAGMPAKLATTLMNQLHLIYRN